jgi:hypothetical protein
LAGAWIVNRSRTTTDDKFVRFPPSSVCHTFRRFFASSWWEEKAHDKKTWCTSSNRQQQTDDCRGEEQRPKRSQTHGASNESETMAEVEVPVLPPPVVKVEDTKPAATETPVSPSVEHRYEHADDADDEESGKVEDDEEEVEEGAKEEDELFKIIEKEEEEKGEPQAGHPSEFTASQSILQKALAVSQVKEKDTDEEKKDNGDKKAEENGTSTEPSQPERVSPN